MSISTPTITTKVAASSGGTKKSLLTPCRRIGLSKRWKTGSFKSPLAEEPVVLSYDSPVVSKAKETPISSTRSTPVIAETKRKGEVQYESKPKRSKRENEHTKKVKKRLIDDGSDSEVETVNVLNVSGCDLLGLDEKKDENLRSSTEKSPKMKQLYVNVEKLTSNVKTIKTKEPETHGNSKTNEKVETLKKSNENSKNQNELLKKTNHTPQERDDSSKKEHDSKKRKHLDKEGEVRENGNETFREKERSDKKDVQKREEKNQTLNLDKKEDTVSRTFSPKTIASQLKTMPLVDCLNDSSSSSKEKTINKRKSKNSIEEYIKRKEKHRSPLANKLSMKKSTKSDSFESDEEFSSTPSSQKSNAQTKNVNKGTKSNDKAEECLSKPHGQESNVPSKNIDRSDTINKILHLEKTVGDKEEQVGRYKHADAYHKLHDVKVLESLTKAWKDGCESALQDLLLKLREHANIDMQELLKKLGAPVDVIEYDAKNGVFL